MQTFNKVIKRYGKHWKLECAVKLEETLTVDPNADGGRLKISNFHQTQLPFSFQLFSDETMTQVCFY